jgi:hypothetical protein
LPIVRTSVRLFGILALAGLAWLTGSGVAWAHAGGLTSTKSEPAVLGLEPAVRGLSVTVVEFGARLLLVNDTGRRVDVLPEPGTVVNALPSVPPGGRQLWADPRVAAATAAPAPPDGRLDWRIPLRVGDTPVTVVGEQTWPPPPAAGLWWGLLALFIAVPAGLAALACRGIPDRDRAQHDPDRDGPALASWSLFARLTLAVSTLVVIVAHVVHIYGAALVPAQGTVIWLFLGAAGFAVVAWPLGLTGVYAVLRRYPAGSLLCLVAGALIAVIISPADLFSFHDAVVPYAWGADLDRALIALNVGGGLGVIAAATILMRHTGTGEPATPGEPATGPAATRRAGPGDGPPGPTG